MKEKSIIEVGESRPAWEALEAYAREGIQRLLQGLLEEEMEEVLMGGVSFGGRDQRPRFGLWSPEGYTAFSSFTHLLSLPRFAPQLMLALATLERTANEA